MENISGDYNVIVEVCSRNTSDNTADTAHLTA